MDELKNEAPQNPEEEVEEIDYEPNHSDKLVGVFTEPAAMFSTASNFPPKTIDWLLPVLIVIIVASLSNFIMMSNPKIKFDVQQKQMEKVEKMFQEMVKNGQLTQEQADEQLDKTREQMEQQMSAGQIMSVVGIVIFTFIVFFIISGYFFAFAKFALKGDGNYGSAMTAYGLPYYVVVLQVIVTVILALATDKFMASASIGDLIGADKSTLTGFLLGKADIFSVWFYALVSIGFAKMFKSENAGKYFAMVFGSWIGVSLLFFFISKAVPFLSFLNM